MTVSGGGLKPLGSVARLGPPRHFPAALARTAVASPASWPGRPSGGLPCFRGNCPLARRVITESLYSFYTQKCLFKYFKWSFLSQILSFQFLNKVYLTSRVCLLAALRSPGSCPLGDEVTRMSPACGCPGQQSPPGVPAAGRGAVGHPRTDAPLAPYFSLGVSLAVPRGLLPPGSARKSALAGPRGTVGCWGPAPGQPHAAAPRHWLLKFTLA